MDIINLKKKINKNDITSPEDYEYNDNSTISNNTKQCY